MASELDQSSAGPITGGVVAHTNLDGSGRFVLVCEHASHHIPARFDGLGLTPEAKTSHIAWDPGALAVAEHLSVMLDSPLISQKISRLVYDCNRPPESPSAIPPVSEIYTVPGNQDLSAEERRQRVDEVYLPFKAALSGLLDRRSNGSGDLPVLVTMHSFTPIYNHHPRAVEVGILHDLDSRLADAIMAGKPEGFNTQRNCPYGPKDGVTHTLVEHALPRDLPNVMIEVRNDLIATPAQQAEMAAWLADILRAALHTLTGNG